MRNTGASACLTRSAASPCESVGLIMAAHSLRPTQCGRRGSGIALVTFRPTCVSSRAPSPIATKAQRSRGLWLARVWSRTSTDQSDTHQCPPFSRASGSTNRSRTPGAFTCIGSLTPAECERDRSTTPGDEVPSRRWPSLTSRYGAAARPAHRGPVAGPRRSVGPAR